MKKKTTIILLLLLIVIVGIITGIKIFQIKKLSAASQNFSLPPVTVTTATVRSETWSTKLAAVGSLEAVQGILVTAELPGKVVKIAFEPGGAVEAGDLLVQQDTSSETAQLRSAQASMELARLNLERAKELLPDKVITKSSYDASEAEYIQAAAQVENITATIKKKTITAPFSGRIGIRLINLGQNLANGESIVSLQSMDPIYVNFRLPQQELATIRKGLTIELETDAYPGKKWTGAITAINPQVDRATRNFQLQATVANTEGDLRPGMFVNIGVLLPKPKEVLSIPSTAILHAPYGDSVFVVEEKSEENEKTPKRIVRQQFVRLGDKRGDFTEVIEGLEKEETIVSTGAFKMRNGQSVVVDNALSPTFKQAPKPEDA
jgi:membrane fusion protein (multidrug efflux system)